MGDCGRQARVLSLAPAVQAVRNSVNLRRQRCLRTFEVCYHLPPPVAAPPQQGAPPRGAPLAFTARIYSHTRLLTAGGWHPWITMLHLGPGASESILFGSDIRNVPKLGLEVAVAALGFFSRISSSRACRRGQEMSARTCTRGGDLDKSLSVCGRMLG